MANQVYIAHSVRLLSVYTEGVVSDLGLLGDAQLERPCGQTDARVVQPASLSGTLAPGTVLRILDPTTGTRFLHVSPDAPSREEG